MDKHYVICIGRQIGSGGRAVARLISERLGINVYDRKLLKSASDQSGFSEEFFDKADEEKSRRPLRSLFMNHLGGGQMTQNYMSNESIFQLQSDAIKRIHEQEDCIIIGRCADYILRDSDRMLNVFLAADTEKRIASICAHDGCDEKKALTVMTDADRKRASYYNYFTGKKWGDSTSYDMCLNTSVFSNEECADMIIDIARKKLGIPSE